MIRIGLLIAAPILIIGLCGAAAAQTGDQSVRTLFADKPLNEGEMRHDTEVASMVQAAERSEASPTEIGMEVTSDSRDYCSRLMRTIDEYNAQSRPENVIELRKKGNAFALKGTSDSALCG